MAKRTSKKRQAQAARRALGDPLELVRAIRHLTSIHSRPVDADERTAVIQRVLVGVAAIDPSLQMMDEDEVTAVQDAAPSMPVEDRGEAMGVKHVPAGSLDPRNMVLASRVGEVRSIVTRIMFGSELTEAEVSRLETAAQGLLEWIGNLDEPLGEQQQLIWDYLLELKPGEAVTSAAIFEVLTRRGHILSEIVIRRHLSGPLRDRGVQNRPQVGYFIPVELRPGDPAED